MKRVFSNFFFTLVEMASQLAIFSFLAIGTAITYIGRENLHASTSESMQIAAIIVIIVSTLLNIGYSLLVIFLSFKNIRYLCRMKQMKKRVDKYEKLLLSSKANPHETEILDKFNQGTSNLYRPQEGRVKKLKKRYLSKKKKRRSIIFRAKSANYKNNLIEHNRTAKIKPREHDSIQNRVI